MFKTIEEASEQIKLAHQKLEKNLKMQAGDDEMKSVYSLYQDICSDLDQLRGKVTTIGCPRSAEILKQAIRTVEECKPILEQELAKPV